MAWTFENFTTMLFGVLVGTCVAALLAIFFSPAVPLIASGPLAFWTAWQAVELDRRYRAEQGTK